MERKEDGRREIFFWESLTLNLNHGDGFAGIYACHLGLFRCRWVLRRRASEWKGRKSEVVGVCVAEGKICYQGKGRGRVRVFSSSVMVNVVNWFLRYICFHVMRGIWWVGSGSALDEI